MYFVDRKKIEENLVYLERLQLNVKKLVHVETEVEKLALERAAYVMIESMMDVGNAMIDGFIMRDPGSYEDILDILDDEKVITPEESVQLKNVISLRKMLIQNFAEVNHKQIIAVLDENAAAIERFSVNVRRYLEQELGPVSAFLPDDQR